MSGLVTLLGAGPGDEELVTVKGLRRLKEADVVVYDRLVNQALLQHVKPTSEKIDVGKAPNMPCVKQRDIEAILIEKAKEGKHVVRLKSGDPYVFGRGGEEGIALKEAGIPFEVVPGVTSAIAGLTYAGIPITYRDIATSFHIITGHLQDENEALNWDAISQLKGTLVFLMGMKNLNNIVTELVTRGFDKETPVGIVEWGTHPQQRSIKGTLETIVSLVSEHQFKAPSVIVIGQVVAFKDDLNFHEALALFGKRVLIQQSETGKLPKLLKDAGASVYTFPARNTFLKQHFTLPDLDKVNGLFVTDAHSWKYFLAELVSQGKDIRSLQDKHIYTLGHHTLKAVKETGVLVDLSVNQFDDAMLVDALNNKQEQFIALVDKEKHEAMTEVFKDIIALETHDVTFDHAVLSDNWQDLDVICLPNSVAAQTLVAVSEQVDVSLKEKPVIVMGEMTRKVVEKAGFTTIVETDEPTILSIVKTCERILN
ncbi:uroporphyrinogen-III C-methyltransferase [Carnobacteriaceae bacterium zg-ZUI78]|nr:uroporphyrinogen-III C-methyltransferase [Carnobacteriaceae bacterium zg-ZUI78]